VEEGVVDREAKESCEVCLSPSSAGDGLEARGRGEGGGSKLSQIYENLVLFILWVVESQFHQREEERSTDTVAGRQIM